MCLLINVTYYVSSQYTTNCSVNNSNNKNT
nr:MAG TPA: hypothetical protein [Caudoviricetes sp.]